jgi:cold shock CspA family protein
MHGRIAWVSAPHILSGVFQAFSHGYLMPRRSCDGKALHRENAYAHRCRRSFNAKSGFGFIRPDDGSGLFVHSGSVKRAGLKPLQENQKISYDVRAASWTEDDQRST